MSDNDALDDRVLDDLEMPEINGLPAVMINDCEGLIDQPETHQIGDGQDA